MDNTLVVGTVSTQRRLHHGTGPLASTASPPRRLTGDDGAAAVEFALIAPFLFLVIFGIIEFGYSFGQFLDVRHGAREGSRLAAVNYKAPAHPTYFGNPQSSDIIAATCSRMSLSTGVKMSIAFPNSGAKTKGNTVTVTITKPLTQITGFLNFALAGRTLTSSVQTRLEQDASYNAVSNIACP